jgi:membrane-associated phospholipid phosphatase
MIIDGMYSHHKPATNRSRIMSGPWTLGDRLWEMNCGILGLGLSIAGVVCITGVLKNVTGKPRPDIIARCIPRAGSKNLLPFGLIDPDEICTQTNHSIFKDGFRSWPSGHSSAAFGGLGYLSLYLAGKLHVMDHRGEVWKTVIVMIPLLAAALVSVTRIMDARHHPFDVITGSLLGMTLAWFSYRQYFPPISEASLKGQAYPRRNWHNGLNNLAEEVSQYSSAHHLEEGRAPSTDSLESEGNTGTRKRAGPAPASFGRSRTYTESAIPLQDRPGWPESSEQAINSEPKFSSSPPHKKMLPQGIEYLGSVDVSKAPGNGHGNQQGSEDNMPKPPPLDRLDDVKLV